jgi:hypothetical protein
VGDFEYVYTGDTIILGNTYSVLSYNEWYPSILYRNDYATQQVKVFVGNMEQVAFDFSKNIGDTIFNVYDGYAYYTQQNFINLRVADVDSIQINSIYYKRMKLIAYEFATDPNLMGGDTTVWVDGFGNIGVNGWYCYPGVMGPSNGLIADVIKSKCFEFNSVRYEVVYDSIDIFKPINIISVTDGLAPY